MSSDASPPPQAAPSPAPPGWNKWKRLYRIEATLDVVEGNVQELIRHLQERPSESVQPTCCVMTCLGYAVGGLCLLFTAPYFLERGSWARDIFDAVGFRNWGFLALAGLLAVGVHSFRPRPGPVETERLAAIQTLLELLSKGALGRGVWKDARWELEPNLHSLESTSPKDVWQITSAKNERTKTYEQEWVRLRGRGEGGRTLDLKIESERVDRTVHHSRTKPDGRVKTSSVEKEPRYRQILRVKLEADDLQIAQARKAMKKEVRNRKADRKEKLHEEEGALRLSWALRGESLDPAVRLLLYLGQAVSAGAP